MRNSGKGGNGLQRGESERRLILQILDMGSID